MREGRLGLVIAATGFTIGALVEAEKDVVPEIGRGHAAHGGNSKSHL
jgi:hypothetical protein